MVHSEVIQMAKQGKMTRISPVLSDELYALRGFSEVEMKRKISLVEASKFLGEFIGDANTKKQIIFNKLKQFREGKYGSLSDLPVAFVILLATAFVIVIFYVIIHNMASGGLVPAGAGTTLVNSFDSKYPSVWDNAFVFGLVGLMLSTFITAFIYKASSWWFWISAMVLGLYVVIVGVPFGLVFEAFATNSYLASYLVGFPKMVFFFDHITTFLVGWGAAIIALNHYSPSGGSFDSAGGLPY